jgi:hypothetical protein
MQPPNPPKLHLNEHLSPRLAAQLRNHGFDITSSHEGELLSEPDDKQLSYAASQQRAIVTFNIRDFSRLHDRYLEEEKEHWGIIFSMRESIGVLLHRLLRLLHSISAEELKNQTRWLNEYKPKRETEKARAIAALRNYTRDQLNDMIEECLNYVMSRVNVLETHFVSGRSGSSERTQATPRKDEFNVMTIDIVLRYSEHKFLFANPQNLESSGDDPNHLQQNYIMGFVFTDEDGNMTLSITDDWYEDLGDVFDTLDSEDAVKEEDMQSDNRYLVANENYE